MKWHRYLVELFDSNCRFEISKIYNAPDSLFINNFWLSTSTVYLIEAISGASYFKRFHS